MGCRMRDTWCRRCKRCGVTLDIGGESLDVGDE